MSIAVSIVIKLFQFFVGSIYKPLVILGFRTYYRKEDKNRPLPKINNELLLIPANKLAEKIRNKEVRLSVL